METITGGGEPLRARVLMATNDFFRVLGVAPLAGRAFLPEDAKGGGKQIVVVSYNFWQRALGGRADLGGVKLRISDRVFEVVGVMPPGFSYPRGFDALASTHVVATAISTISGWFYTSRIWNPVCNDGINSW
jgi:hypothetical protein